LFPDFLMQNYDVSADGKRVTFITGDSAGRTPVWLASIDGSSAPRRLTSIDAIRALFGPRGEIIFVGGETERKYIYRINEDGSGLKKVSPDEAVFIYDASPDGKWIAAWMVGSSEQNRNSIVVYPTDGGSSTLICGSCASAGGPERGHTPALVSWSPDGTFLYLTLGGAGTYAVPVPPGQILPPIPESGLRSPADVAALPGARLVSQQPVFGGPDLSIYVSSRVATQRNIYRIRVP
jgi:Tol biopolymer transport system component